jgi:hypothetical protein
MLGIGKKYFSFIMWLCLNRYCLGLFVQTTGLIVFQHAQKLINIGVGMVSALV